MLLVTALVAVIVFAVIFKFLRPKPRILNGKSIPKHKELPFVGLGLEITERNSIYKFEELAKTYGEIFSFDVFGQNIVVLNTEQLMKKAYCSKKYEKYFCDRPQTFYGSYFRPGGTSVGFSSDGKGRLFKQMKKAYMRAVHTYGNGIKNLENKLLTELREFMEQIETLDTNDFDFVTLVRRSLSNTLSLVLIGESIPPGDPDEDLFWHRIEVLNFFASHRNDCIISFCPLLRLMSFTKYGRMYTMGVENQRRIVERYFNTVKKQDRTGKDGGMVDFYLEQQKKMKLINQEIFFTDEIIQSQILDTIEG